MYNRLIREDVDIYQLPQVSEDQLAQKNIEITIGDLHGNAIKLMFMLIKHGVASGVTQVDYQALVEIYNLNVEELTTESLNQFNDILSRIQFKSEGLIRLIGDEFADRGSNDYFTLKILEKLHENQVAFEILISNHGFEFINAYETGQQTYLLDAVGHAPSLHRLFTLINKELVNKAEIQLFVNQCYQKNLKLVAYSLSEDGQQINIYSHAALDLNIIRQLASKFSVSYADDSALYLARTIDAINQQFQIHVQAGKAHKLFDLYHNNQGYLGEQLSAKQPLEFLLWNRYYSQLQRPAKFSNYHMNFIHGHDSGDLLQGNIYNLDNALGKFMRRVKCRNGACYDPSKGQYSVLYFQANPNLLLKEHQQGAQIPKGLLLNREPELHPTISQSAFRPVKPILTSTSQLNVLPHTISLSAIHHFNQAVLDLDKKILDLQERGHHEVSATAAILKMRLKDLFNEFRQGKKSVDEFTNQSLNLIDSERAVLETHRGWKQLLGNLCFAILGLGVFYMAAICVNKFATGRYLFFKTDTADKLDKLEHCIKSFKDSKSTRVGA